MGSLTGWVPAAVRLSRAVGARWAVYEHLARALAPRALEQPAQPALLAVAMPRLRRLTTSGGGMMAESRSGMESTISASTESLTSPSLSISSSSSFCNPWF